jgi:hypothetical protein
MVWFRTMFHMTQNKQGISPPRHQHRLGDAPQAQAGDAGAQPGQAARRPHRDGRRLSRRGAHGLGCFNSIADAACTHEPIATVFGRKAARHPAFKAINTVLGNIKSAIAAIDPGAESTPIHSNSRAQRIRLRIGGDQIRSSAEAQKQ